jgi:hypothetical protein
MPIRSEGAVAWPGWHDHDARPAVVRQALALTGLEVTSSTRTASSSKGRWCWPGRWSVHRGGGPSRIVGLRHMLLQEAAHTCCHQDRAESMSS